MADNKEFEVVIIGGSYAGLSAAMSLGRALRRVLVVDSGKPCNRQTPHSHNFITQDGKKPADIANEARKQVLQYDTVKFYEGLAVSGRKTDKGFETETQSGEVFISKKLIFATGLRDIMPGIDGFAECWGISILHCPYCHGYEVKNEKTAILANGDTGYHYAGLIRNWTKDLQLFTNGKSTFTAEQEEKIRKHQIPVIEKEIDRIEHDSGKIQAIVFKDQSKIYVKAVYSKPAYKQHCPIPEKLGCELTEEGLINTDKHQRTTVEGVYACGDSTAARTVSLAFSTGTLAGLHLNNKLTEEEFEMTND